VRPPDIILTQCEQLAVNSALTDVAAPFMRSTKLTEYSLSQLLVKLNERVAQHLGNDRLWLSVVVVDGAIAFMPHRRLPTDELIAGELHVDVISLATSGT
jgi:hypothetical protein